MFILVSLPIFFIISDCKSNILSNISNETNNSMIAIDFFSFFFISSRMKYKHFSIHYAYNNDGNTVRQRKT